jgi:hypothetical protein
MTTPPADVLAVVQPHEDEVTEEVGDEPMRIVGREISAFHVWVLGGWENYVVRGSEIVWQSEDSVVAAVTIGARTVLLVRGSDGPVLMVPTDDDLERVDPDAAPETATTEAAE